MRNSNFILIVVNLIMETKEIKIDTPEGYEIDRENSTFECIKFKQRTKRFVLGRKRTVG